MGGAHSHNKCKKITYEREREGLQEVIRFAPLILVRWNRRDPSLLTLAILTSSSLPTHKQSTVEHCRQQGIWRLLSPKFPEQELRLGRRSVQRTQRMDKHNHHFTWLQAQMLVRILWQIATLDHVKGS